MKKTEAPSKQHYKGNRYKIIGIARHTETLEEQVIYQDIVDAHKLWARPVSMFQESVILEKEQCVPRFRYIEQSSV
jgi:hypothetical protein